MLGGLNHPNVLRFYGVVVAGREDPAVIGIMTEFMRGGSLAQFLRCARVPPGRPTSCPAVGVPCELVSQSCVVNRVLLVDRALST